MSNGDMMTYRMAWHTTVFTAIGPVADTIVSPCDDPAPVSVLHIHGLDDERVRHDGEQGSGATRVDGMPIGRTSLQVPVRNGLNYPPNHPKPTLGPPE